MPNRKYNGALKMKVLLYTHDPMLTLVRTEEEAKELFGDDCMDDDCAVEIPDELAAEAQAVYNRMCEISQQLRSIRTKYDEEIVSKRLCRKCGKWKHGVVGQFEERRCPDCIGEKHS